VKCGASNLARSRGSPGAATRTDVPQSSASNGPAKAATDPRLRPFVEALADVLVADLLRMPPKQS
jgi:hypothetical protein